MLGANFKSNKSILLIFALALPQIAGFVGALFTVSAIPNWYATLQKPLIAPPNWVFGPVWTILYFLMGLAFFLLLKAKKSKQKNEAVKYFYKQLILNSVWSIAFFGLKSPILGFVVIVFLWISILITIIRFAKVSVLASQLLYPYLAWVSFASMLNFWIYLLNP